MPEQIRARIRAIVETFDVSGSLDTMSERARQADALTDALLEAPFLAERPDHAERPGLARAGLGHLGVACGAWSPSIRS